MNPGHGEGLTNGTISGNLQLQHPANRGAAKMPGGLIITIYPIAQYTNPLADNLTQ